MTQGDAQHMGTLWLLNLNGPLPAGIVTGVPAVFMRAGPESAQELAQAMALESSDAVLQRFHAGRRCYIGRVECKVAVYGWVTFDKEEIGELGLRLRFGEGEAYIWDCVTLPAYRGQRLFPALLAYILGQLCIEGIRRAWIGADTENVSSQSSFRRVGFRPVADIMRTAGEPLWLRGHDGAAEKDVEDAHALFGETVKRKRGA